MQKREITIGSRIVSDDSAAYVIAEIGHNHEGDLGKAERLFSEAVDAGVSAVKLQKRQNKTLYTKAMYEKDYTGRNSYGRTYGAHREALEFDRDQYIHLRKLSTDLGVDFISTAFDMPSVDFLVDIGVDAIKIASGDLDNTPLQAYAARSGKPLIVSTGGGDLEAVRRAVDTILPENPRLALLQCTSIYPAEPEDLNLSVIETYRREFPSAVIGFSGHDAGPELSWVAYTLGARVIEKHCTLDRRRPGSDHHFSLEPADLCTLVDGLVRTRKALGDPVKRPLPGEREAMIKMGKRLVAARDLPAGHRLSEEDVAIKSPGGGTPPYLLPEIIGRSLVHAVAADADLTPGRLR